MLLEGYKSAKWSTFAQYKDDKNSIKKGEHGTYITLAIISKSKDENGEEDETKSRVFYKGYSVFNEEQTEKGGAKASETKQTETKKEDQAIKLLEEVKTITQNFWTNYEVVA